MEEAPTTGFCAGEGRHRTYLKRGKNTIEVDIATTLMNVLRPIWAELRFSATTARENVPPAQKYGLLGPVVVVAYAETLIGGKR